MGIRTQTLNNAKDWNESRRYKVNEVVKKQGFFYQNITGKNSDPFFLTDWIQVGKIEPKVYKALLSQTGVNAPVATVLENSIGNIVWSRIDPGTYVATSEGKFISNLYIPSGTSNDGDTSPSHIINSVKFNTNEVLIKVITLSTEVAEDGFLFETPFLIEIYP